MADRIPFTDQIADGSELNQIEIMNGNLSTQCVCLILHAVQCHRTDRTTGTVPKNQLRVIKRCFMNLIEFRSLTEGFPMYLFHTSSNISFQNMFERISNKPNSPGQP